MTYLFGIEQPTYAVDTIVRCHPCRLVK